MDAVAVEDSIEDLATELWLAEVDRKPTAPLTGRKGEISRQQAYRVQLRVAEMRRALGHRVVGRKVGLVSKAMQEMAGFAEPDYGHLFDVMRIEDREQVDMGTLIQPLVEPEIAFVLDRPLRGPGVTPSDVIRATAFVAPSLEIVDSRIKQWKIRWIDTVADNGSSARFVLGSRVTSPRNIDFRTVGTLLHKNEQLFSTSAMAEVMGDPVRAVAWLINKLAEWEITAEAGEVLLPGSPCRAMPVQSGDFVQAEMAGLGSVSAYFK